MYQNRKIVIQRLGESFRECTEIVEEPVDEPGPGQVLVRHHYVGVNGVYDQMMCLNRVEHTRVEPPADAGVEAAGLIEAAGPGVEDLTPGTAVAVVRAGRGYRELQRVSASEIIVIPSVSPEILALVPSGVSALVALEQVGEMRSDETVCISAAAGGLGNIAVQLAVNAGNHVVAVCGDDRKAAWLQSRGVHRVVQHRKEDLASVLDNEYANQLDLAMDSVGGATFDAMVRNLAPLGRLVACGYTSDRLPTETPTQERIYTQLYWKAASIRGFMNHRFARYASDARQRLIRMTQDGVIQPLVDQTVFKGLESVAEAVEYLLAGQNLGKVVVDLQ